jgi:DNA-binding CsgD family transcriptional regulator
MKLSGAMVEFDQTFVTDLVGHIYEAAVDADHWDVFLATLATAYPDSRITLFGHENGRPCEALTRRFNFADDDLKAYVDHHVKTSPHLARVHQVPVGKAIYSEVMIGDEELKKTEHYNEYVKPRGLGHYATGVVVERRPGRITAFSVADHKNDEERRASQIRLLDILAPHFARAFRLHRIVAANKVNQDVAQAAFDRWAHAALVLDSSGRMMGMNRAAEVLLQRADGLWLSRDGHLRTFDETCTRALDLAVRQCAAIGNGFNGDARSRELDGVMLPRSGRAPLRVMVWPLPFLGGAGTSEFGPGSVLMVLFDADNVRRTPIAWMGRQYGLTPSEQRLTEAIINGVPLAEAAEELGIRLSTARTRLKTIQTKTQCHRQVDLVRLALSLPAVRTD